MAKPLDDRSNQELQEGLQKGESQKRFFAAGRRPEAG
jgi:hypothetical protein